VQTLLVVVVARDEIRLEPRRNLEIGVTETVQAGQQPEVLDPGVDEADERPHADEESNRQDEECEHVETVAKLGRLGSKGQRNDGRGHDGQEDGGSTVDRAVRDAPRREQAPMLGREDLDALGLRHVEVRVGGHRASSRSRAEPSPDPGREIVRPHSGSMAAGVVCRALCATRSCSVSPTTA